MTTVKNQHPVQAPTVTTPDIPLAPRPAVAKSPLSQNSENKYSTSSPKAGDGPPPPSLANVARPPANTNRPLSSALHAGQSSSMPSLPPELLAEIEKNPNSAYLNKTAESRKLEEPLAIALRTNPQVLATVNELVHRVAHFVQQTDPGMSTTKLFAGKEFNKATGRMGEQRYWATGDIPEASVASAMQDGNLREQMNMLINSIYKIDGMVRKAVRPEGGAQPSSLINAEHVLSRLDGPKQPNSYEQLWAGTHELDGETRVKRKVPAPTKNPDATAQMPQADTRVSAARTTRRTNEISPPLSAREKDLLNGFLTTPAFPEAKVARELEGTQTSEDAPEYDLPQRLVTDEGRNVFRADVSKPWVQQSVDKGLAVTAGISNSTSFMLNLWRTFKGNDEGLKNILLACVGFYVPDHHSFHEVMTAGKEFGLKYDGNIDTLRSMTNEYVKP